MNLKKKVLKSEFQKVKFSSVKNWFTCFFIYFALIWNNWLTILRFKLKILCEKQAIKQTTWHRYMYSPITRDWKWPTHHPNMDKNKKHIVFYSFLAHLEQQIFLKFFTLKISQPLPLVDWFWLLKVMYNKMYNKNESIQAQSNLFFIFWGKSQKNLIPMLLDQAWPKRVKKLV